MTTPIETEGRFCNHLIRNICLSELCKNNNSKMKYSFYEKIENLGIPLFKGELEYETTTLINDDNFLSLLNDKNKLETNFLFEHKDIYLQTKEISLFLYNYLQSIRMQIIQKNLFKLRYENNNDCFIHVRLGDMHYNNPGLNYYETILNQIEFDDLYISSDSPYHPLVQELKEKYINANIIYTEEVRTIQFASTCKNVILSHGSFSATIGYLSFYSQVYYPSFKNMKRWHGDIFSINSWNCIDF